VGIVLSSLGQALQCIVVAPRLLASIADDGMLRPLTPLSKLTQGGAPATSEAQSPCGGVERVASAFDYGDSLH